MSTGSEGGGDADDAYGDTVPSTPTLEGTEARDSFFGQLFGETRNDEQIATDRAYTEALENNQPTFVDGAGVTQDTFNYGGRESSTPEEGGKFEQPMSVSLGPVSLISGATMLATGGASKLGGPAASFALGRVAAAVDSLLGNKDAISVGLDKQGNITTGGSIIDSFRGTPGEPISLSPMATGAAYAQGGSAPSAPPSGPPSLVDNVLQDNSMLDRSRSLLDRGIY